MCKICTVSQTFYWLVTCGVLSLIFRYLTLDHELEKIYPTLIKKKKKTAALPSLPDLNNNRE